MSDSNQKSSMSSTPCVCQNNQDSIESISLNLINNNKDSLKDSKIVESNDISLFDKNLNEKIVKLLIGDHPLLPMITIEKIAYCNFMSQHFKGNDIYNVKVIDEIIHNESSHVVAEFKDYLIKGDISEFLQQYYKKEECLNLLPKIYEYYISCSVIFPNYVILPESQYIYKNIQRKQRVIDIQQEQEDKEENIKNGIIKEEKELTVFNTQAIDSILNQTDTSGVKKYFGISSDVSKGAGEPDMMKLVNNIEKVEGKINKSNNKKKVINVCKLKKANNNELLQVQNALMLNEGGYSKKIIASIHKNSGTAYFERKNSSHNNKIYNRNSLKQILRQITENNNIYKKKNNFSIQFTYIDSYNSHLKSAFDLKGIESIKKLGKNTKGSKDKIKDRVIVRQLYKNNSQKIQCLRYINSKERFSNYYNVVNKTNKSKNKNHIKHRESSGNYSINQSVNKHIKRERTEKNFNSIHKEYFSRNNDKFSINNNIRTFFEDPFKNIKINKNKNTITCYKTKSKSKNKYKSKGYQTSRNKYDNKQIYINVSTNNAKTSVSKNHQSLDVEINEFIKRKTVNQMKYKHNSLKNNLITALLGSGNNNQRKKMNRYKNMLIQKNINDSLVDSIDFKNMKDTNDKKLNVISNNEDNSYINKEKGSNEEITNIFLYNNDKSTSHKKKVISSSDSNNKFSSTSCTKTITINSHMTKPKKSCSNLNSINHKNQISISKIPNSLAENKILYSNKLKKKKKSNEEIESRNTLKEFIDNYLDDYFSSKTNSNSNFNCTQTNKFVEAKGKCRNININNTLAIKNPNEKRKEKEDNNTKIRNSIFNFEKRISKKLSEKTFNVLEKFKSKISPKNNTTKKSSSIRTNKSGNTINSELGPISARESNSNYQINSGVLELLSNKIQKIKQSIKETSDKGSNSISSIFKKKKIPASGRKNLLVGPKKKEENTEKRNQNCSKTRNKKNNNCLYGVVSSNSNIDLNGNIVNSIINSIYQTNLLSPNKNNSEYDKLIKTFQKFKRPKNSNSGNSISNNSKINSYSNSNNNMFNYSKKDSKKKKRHGRCNSIYNNNNYENHLNIEVNIKNNLRVQSKKSLNNINNKNQNDNVNSLNINFNNFTNNYNYNYNINSMNNINNNQINNSNIRNNNCNNINYNNSIKSKGKSNSQKLIMGKIINKNDANLKGIPINGFDKLITKKYNTRNYNIPMSVTDRIKQSNLYTTSIINNNTNSNRYKNISKNRNSKINNNRAYHQKIKK